MIEWSLKTEIKDVTHSCCTNLVSSCGKYETLCFIGKKAVYNTNDWVYSEDETFKVKHYQLI
jgi:hypothetical protein